MEIKHKITGMVLFASSSRSLKACIKAAIKAKADLRWADLRWADLQGADLRWADLREANLQGANLQGANLREADLREADLREADLDFSSGFYFGCSSFSIKADLRLAAQMAYHFCRFEFTDDEAKKAQEALKSLANKFHRVDECGKIK